VTYPWSSSSCRLRAMVRPVRSRSSAGMRSGVVAFPPWEPSPARPTKLHSRVGPIVSLRISGAPLGRLRQPVGHAEINENADQQEASGR